MSVYLHALFVCECVLGVGQVICCFVGIDAVCQRATELMQCDVPESVRIQRGHLLYRPALPYP